MSELALPTVEDKIRTLIEGKGTPIRPKQEEPKAPVASVVWKAPEPAPKP